MGNEELNLKPSEKSLADVFGRSLFPRVNLSLGTNNVSLPARYNLLASVHECLHSWCEPERYTEMKNHADEHEAFAASRSSEHVYVPIDDRNFTTLDKHAETIEMDAKLPLVSAPPLHM